MMSAHRGGGVVFGSTGFHGKIGLGGRKIYIKDGFPKGSLVSCGYNTSLVQ